MSKGKVLTLVSMVALFLALASFAGQPGFAGEKLIYVSDGDLAVDYTRLNSSARLVTVGASDRRVNASSFRT